MKTMFVAFRRHRLTHGFSAGQLAEKVGTTTRRITLYEICGRTKGMPRKARKTLAKLSSKWFLENFNGDEIGDKKCLSISIIPSTSPS